MYRHKYIYKLIETIKQLEHNLHPLCLKCSNNTVEPFGQREHNCGNQTHFKLKEPLSTINNHMKKKRALLILDLL